MKQARCLVLLLVSSVAGASLGCSGEAERSGEVITQPEPIADHECGACGMIVREQPSPRGQVVHHDGTHVWLCSLADLVAYASAPSPHGRVEERWVETLAADVDPAADDVAQRPWTRVADAHFVFGVERESVMGTAVLTFAGAADASSAAARLHGQVVEWSDVERALGGTP